ncbi:MAG: SCO family protein [Acidobacteriota bacterium]
MRRNILFCLSPILGAILFAGCSTGDRVGSETALPRLFESPSFQLTSETEKTVSRSDLLGKVWVVDFIFTRCAGPCPLMTQRMKTLQDELSSQGLLGPESDVRLVSITVDPEYDTPRILEDYGKLWGARPGTWIFLTGPPDTLLSTIQTGFKVTATREPSSADMPGMPQIRHGTNFLLVDKQGWIRRIAHLEDPDLETSLTRDIQALLKEG